MIPDLTPAQYERLAILMEEAAEVIQIIGKIQRHGYESRHPDGGPTNREMLEKEIGHVNYAVNLLWMKAEIAQSSILFHRNLKEKMKGYLL